MPKTSMMTRDSHLIGFEDTIIIYYSAEDSCWIAHSLRTDQIGACDHPVSALVALVKAVRAIVQLAKRDESIAYLREAPPEIQRRARNAKLIPASVFGMACDMAAGDWPSDWSPPDLRSNSKQAMKLIVPRFAA